jgi:hypothetical protein
MSSSLTVSSRQFGVFPISTGLYPREGSRCVSCQYDWTSTTTYNEDLTQLIARGFETTIQSAYIDNSSVSQYVSLTAPGTGQILKIPPYSQGFFPLFVSGMGGFTLAIPGPEDSVTRVLLCNVPAQSAAVWKGAFPPSFSLDFTTGSLGAGAVFSRASPGWYYNSSGLLVQAANDAPRFDYDPVTLQLKGLLLEDASTNIWLQSGDASNAAWLKASGGGPAVPVATANQTTAPDGTLTAASIVFPNVSIGGSFSAVYQTMTTVAGTCAFSVWLKGLAGGEQLYLAFFSTGAPRVTLTKQWQRFTWITPTPSGASSFLIGTDLRGAGIVSTPAQTIYAWGAQVEAIGYVTSYIPTLAATVTRAADLLRYPIASVTGFDQTKGSLAHEYYMEGAVTYGGPVQFIGVNSGSDCIFPDGLTPAGQTRNDTPFLDAARIRAASVDQAAANFTQIPVLPNVVHRGAMGWQINTQILDAHDGIGPAALFGVTTALPVITALQIGGSALYQNPVSQWARRTRYWPRQLSQADLIALTR